MGIWRGKAALPADGDWSHGPKLRLKFNDHGSVPWYMPANVNKDLIGQAYGLALTAVQIARGIYKESAYQDKFGEYFKKEPDDEGFRHVGDVLASVENGLRDNSKENRIYLFTGASKNAIDKDMIGYVASYSAGSAKQGLPQQLTYPRAEGQQYHSLGDRTLQQKGHIHLNMDKMKGASVSAVAQTIIHEASHRFAGTGDFAYQTDTRTWLSLTPEKALNNADTYGFYCLALYAAFKKPRL